MHPAVPIQFHFFGSRNPRINRAWVEELMLVASGPNGLTIVPEPSEKVQALSAPGQPKPWVGSPQEAPALALLVSVITVVLAGTVSVQPLMTVAQSAVSSIATRDAIPVSAQPNKPTVEIADAK